MLITYIHLLLGYLTFKYDLRNVFEKYLTNVPCVINSARVMPETRQKKKYYVTN